MHTYKLTTKCNLCAYLYALWRGIWDWQSTIVEDLNDSQDPKHTLFCRENAFVVIYALFSDNKCRLFTRLGGVCPKRTLSAFLPFLLWGLPCWFASKFAADQFIRDDNKDFDRHRKALSVINLWKFTADRFIQDDNEDINQKVYQPQEVGCRLVYQGW